MLYSWHNINGESGEELLPAILVTDRHPHEFKESFSEPNADKPSKKDFETIVFPLKKYCKTTTDVAAYVDKIFKNIIEKKSLLDFRVLKKMKRGLGKSVVDGLILEPNIAGVSYDFKPLIQYFTGK